MQLDGVVHTLTCTYHAERNGRTNNMQRTLLPLRLPFPALLVRQSGVVACSADIMITESLTYIFAIILGQAVDNAALFGELLANLARNVFV